MNYFNGLLCAAGLQEGCLAVKNAQGRTTAEWYRSPRQRWNVENKCPRGKAQFSSEQTFCDECTSTFSPEMGLGVMLYTLATKDHQAFSRWIDQLEQIGNGTKLCVGPSCTTTPWPRICTNDYACGTKAPKKVAGTFTSGICLLLPTASEDYRVMADHEKKTLGPLMLVATESTHAVAGPIRNIVDYAFAATYRANYPMHVESVRVLLRMMIQNPNLSLQRLPNIPPPPTLPMQPIPGLSSEDPLSLSVRANRFRSRQPWNPYYKLLSEGPTGKARDLIIKNCPTLSSSPPENEKRFWLWRWETDKGGERGLEYSSGWDCVFVGMLYNKMRVEQPIIDQLCAMFNQYRDPTGSVRSQLRQDLAKANAVVDATDRALKGAASAFDAQQKAKLKAQRDLLEGLNREALSLSKTVLRKLPSCPKVDPVCKRARKAVLRSHEKFHAQLANVNTRIHRAQAEIENIAVTTLRNSQEAVAVNWRNAQAQFLRTSDALLKAADTARQAAPYVKLWGCKVSAI